MNVHCLVLLATAHSSPGNVPAPDLFQVTVGLDQSLEGSWSATSVEYDGNKIATRCQVRFAGGAMDLRIGAEAVGFNYRSGRGALDCTVLGRRIPAIYRLAGKRLYLCFGREGGARPRTFTTAPRSGHVLLILERQRP